MQVWLNGKFEAANSARVDVSSAGLTLGWGVFTTIGVWRKRPFALDRHLARLRCDAARVQIEVVFDDQTLENALLRLIEMNLGSNHARDEGSNAPVQSDGVARITITQRGDGRWNRQQGSDVCVMFQPHKKESIAKTEPAAFRRVLQKGSSNQSESTFQTTTGNTSTHAAPFAEARRTAQARSADESTEGKVEESPRFARLMMSGSRVEARRALCGVKSTSYGDYFFAWREAVARGFDEAVLRNHRGALCECARSSLFWTHHGELRTPSLRCGALPGIARALVLEWAQDDAIPLREGIFSPRELDCAEEIFITSAAQGPRAVGHWNNGALARTLAAPGPLTSHFLHRWSKAVDCSPNAAR